MDVHHIKTSVLSDSSLTEPRRSNMLGKAVIHAGKEIEIVSSTARTAENTNYNEERVFFSVKSQLGIRVREFGRHLRVRVAVFPEKKVLL